MDKYACRISVKTRTCFHGIHVRVLGIHVRVSEKHVRIKNKSGKTDNK